MAVSLPPHNDTAYHGVVQIKQDDASWCHGDKSSSTVSEHGHLFNARPCYSIPYPSLQTTLSHGNYPQAGLACNGGDKMSWLSNCSPQNGPSTSDQPAYLHGEGHPHPQLEEPRWISSTQNTYDVTPSSSKTYCIYSIQGFNSNSHLSTETLKHCAFKISATHKS